MTRALWRQPLLHFAVLGAVLFSAGGWRDSSPAIVISSAEHRRLLEEWQARHGATATPADETLLLEKAIDEAILTREARGLGLDRGDRLVRERLVQLGRGLGLAADGDGDALEGEARAVGLAESDPVIRRYLVELMRLALGGVAPAPDEASVEARHGDVAATFAQPAGVRLTQIYLARRPGSDADAARLLERLRHEGIDPRQAAAFGDPWVGGANLAAQSRVQLERTFGADFAAAIATAPEGEWIGPVPSAYGQHLVWVHERTAPRRPPLEAVRARVALALERERREAQVESRLRALRASYRVVVE